MQVIKSVRTLIYTTAHKNQTVTNAPQPRKAENSCVLRCLPKVPIESVVLRRSLGKLFQPHQTIVCQTWCSSTVQYRDNVRMIVMSIDHSWLGVDSRNKMYIRRWTFMVLPLLEWYWRHCFLSFRPSAHRCMRSCWHNAL